MIPFFISKNRKRLTFIFLLLCLILFIYFIFSIFFERQTISHVSFNLFKQPSMIISHKNDDKNPIQDSFIPHTDSICSLSIPSIGLNHIPIENGIEENILNEFIGHFPHTSYLKGNIGLAAHNRGYSHNYFMNLNCLNNNDLILYHFNGMTKTYLVSLKIEIDHYDWSFLEPTEENKITLITCIANEPNKRLVVQALEKGGMNHEN